MSYLEMEGITKSYPGVVANDDVDFAVERGEVHALVGENGAGKTTLMRILYGLEEQDSGRIYLDGQQVDIPYPQVAIDLGIGMVHQHFKLIQPFTVGENIVLGNEPRKNRYFMDLNRVNERVRQLTEDFGFDIDPNTTVSDLSLGIQQVVEILKLLYRDAELLIFDEPTSVLTPHETEGLFELIYELRDKGNTVIYITHRLSEVKEISDRVTVLRNGRVVEVKKTKATSQEEIAELMVGEEVETVTSSAEKTTKETQPVIETRDLSVKNNLGLTAVDSVSMEVHPGEIATLVGVEGNGQAEFVESLVGLRLPGGGQLIFDGEDITKDSVRERRDRGISLIPQEKYTRGVSPESSFRDNFISTSYHKEPTSSRGILNLSYIKSAVKNAINEYNIQIASSTAKISSLSGGNVQKAILARELSGDQKFIIASHPTQGIDVKSIQFVHQKLLDLKDQGKGILLVTGDLDEALKLSDRIMVMYEGEIVYEVSGKDADKGTLGKKMTAGGGMASKIGD